MYLLPWNFSRSSLVCRLFFSFCRFIILFENCEMENIFWEESCLRARKDGGERIAPNLREFLSPVVRFFVAHLCCVF